MLVAFVQKAGIVARTIHSKEVVTNFMINGPSISARRVSRNLGLDNCTHIMLVLLKMLRDF